jgi:hypothetical protein
MQGLRAFFNLGVAASTPSKHWEGVGDFRVTNGDTRKKAEVTTYTT